MTVIPNTTTFPPLTTTTSVTTHTTMPVATKPSLAEAFNPKRAGTKTSHVIFVLDDSASMQSCRDSTISGYNEYLQAQKKDAKETGIDTFISLYKFDGKSVNCVFSRVSVDEVNELDMYSYNPRGTTNLYDAIGGVMMQINTQLSLHKKKDRDSIIITILTDGAENASRTFDNTNVKQMVEKAEGKNWGFMFLGANINAFAAGANLGFNSNNTMQYDTGSMLNTMRSASAMTSRMKSAYASGMETTLAYATTSFTDQERTAAVTRDDQ
jgi:Mg-chelatase subunit ChlD